MKPLSPYEEAQAKATVAMLTCQATRAEYLKALELYKVALALAPNKTCRTKMQRRIDRHTAFIEEHFPE